MEWGRHYQNILYEKHFLIKKWLMDGAGKKAGCVKVLLPHLMTEFESRNPHG